MKVLIADDQPLERRILRMTLEKAGYEVVECEDGREALELLLDADGPKLAILDWMMPGFSGPEICAGLRKRETDHYTYIILVTSRDDKEDVVAGMESGADDYIVKPVNAHELQVRLRAGRRIVELQEELIAARDHLREQATRDFLTKVWNRAAIMEKLDEEIHRARRFDDPFGVIMCDIDHFKSINDTHGHAVGDDVLRDVAARLKNTLRGYDSVGRYGGEEFMILLPSSCGDGAMEIGERLRRAVADTPVKSEAGPLNVTMSFGVYSTKVDDTTNPHTLITTADAALYEAKHGGRNRVCLAGQAAPVPAEK